MASIAFQAFRLAAVTVFFVWLALTATDSSKARNDDAVAVTRAP
jgi:hypothetical protein